MKSPLYIHGESAISRAIVFRVVDHGGGKFALHSPTRKRWCSFREYDLRNESFGQFIVQPDWVKEWEMFELEPVIPSEQNNSLFERAEFISNIVRAGFIPFAGETWDADQVDLAADVFLGALSLLGGVQRQRFMLHNEIEEIPWIRSMDSISF